MHRGADPQRQREKPGNTTAADCRGGLPWPGETPKKGGLPVKLARTCAGIGAVCSVGIALALLCDHLAALLDAAIAIC